MATNKLNLIMKKDKATTDIICEDLLPASYIRDEVKATVGRDIDDNTCARVRAAALDSLQGSIDTKLQETYKEEEVFESLTTLAAIVKGAAKNHVGWRPESDVQTEIYPHNRPAHVEYKERLIEEKKKLLREIKAEEAALARETGSKTARKK